MRRGLGAVLGDNCFLFGTWKTDPPTGGERPPPSKGQWQPAFHDQTLGQKAAFCFRRTVSHRRRVAFGKLSSNAGAWPARGGEG